MTYARRNKHKAIVDRFLSWSLSVSLLLLQQIGVFHWIEARTVIVMREYLYNDPSHRDPRGDFFKEE